MAITSGGWIHSHATDLTRLLGKAFWCHPSLALAPMKCPHLHQVAANPHVAPAAPVSLARIVEEEQPIGIGASPDKRRRAWPFNESVISRRRSATA